MDRLIAIQFCKDKLKEHGLENWKVRLNNDVKVEFLGKCIYADKLIILNGIGIDVHPRQEVEDTVLHEIAHALVGPGHGHDNVWASKAAKIGANPTACSFMNISPAVLDAIRSGNTVEVEIDEEIVTTVIRTPRYKINKIIDLCPTCGREAVEKFRITTIDKNNGDSIHTITLDCFHIKEVRVKAGTPFQLMVSNDWKPEIKNCKHRWGNGQGEELETQCQECNEFRLFDFQITGARFVEGALRETKGAAIFDDMGVGKTVQSLAVIRYNSEELTPTLYVVKSKTKFQWLKEIVRWIGPSHAGQIIQSGRDVLLPGFKTYIIGYDMFRNLPKERWEGIDIKCAILDECQQIKNVDSTRTQEVRKILGKPEVKVIPLSGTPWKNRGSEFYQVLNLIAPNLFPSYQRFLDTWVDYYMHGNTKKQGGIKNPEKFKEYTKRILIRREFDEVMKNKIGVNRMKLPVQLDEISQDSYDESESDFVAWFKDAVLEGREEQVSGMEIIAQMQRMRHITGLAKIPATVTFCEEFYENTDRSLVIFVHHKDVGTSLVHSLKECFKDNDDVVIETLTAAKGDVLNNKVASEFNRDGKRWFVVASTLACGEGIDGLQAGFDAVLHERQWNAPNEDQAVPGRFKRIGQRSGIINVTCPEAEDTVDVDMNAIVETKRKYFHAVMNKGEVPIWNEGEMAKEVGMRILDRFKKKNPNRAKKNITKFAKPETRLEQLMERM